LNWKLSSTSSALLPGTICRVATGMAVTVICAKPLRPLVLGRHLHGAEPARRYNAEFRDRCNTLILGRPVNGPVDEGAVDIQNLRVQPDRRS
jgi:hypothetical protein